jgi:hypothetical protein
MRTHILCSITFFFFSENRTVYEIMSKNVVVTEGPQMTSQYGAYALRAGLARLYARMGMHTPTRPGTHMHARTRKHAHTDQYIIHIAFTQPHYYVLRTLPVLLFLDVCCECCGIVYRWFRYTDKSIFICDVIAVSVIIEC